MLGEKAYKGYWWLPGADDDRLAGDLLVTDGRAELTVLSSFGHRTLSQTQGETTYSIEPEPVRRILGLTADGKCVTLEGCSVPTFQHSSPGIPRTTYRARVAVIGAWFSEDEEVAFDEVSLVMSDLDLWVGISAIRTDIEFEPGTTIAKGVNIAFEPTEPIVIPLADGAEVRVVFSFTLSGMSQVTTEGTIRQSAALHYHPASNPLDLDGVGSIVGSFRNFLSLAIGRPQTVISVTGYRGDVLWNDDPNRRIPIEILYSLQHNPEPPTKARLAHEVLFSLPSVGPSISDVMSAWFERAEILAPVFNLYFGMLYHPSMYLDVKFLVYAQALETYDFRRRTATDLPPEEHEARVEAVLDAVPTEHREWVEGRLAHSNYLTLRRRIKDVLNECTLVRDRVAGASSSARGSFMNGFVDSRNYYTHYNPALEASAATSGALYLLVLQLQTIIETCLLRELAFSCEDIDATLDRIGRYREIDHFRRVVAEGRSASTEAVADTPDDGEGDNLTPAQL